jgi:hypothetical protein
MIGAIFRTEMRGEVDLDQYVAYMGLSVSVELGTGVEASSKPDVNALVQVFDLLAQLNKPEGRRGLYKRR